MNKRLCYLFILSLALPALSSSVSGTLYGNVTDARTLHGVDSCLIIISGLDATFRTDRRGDFYLENIPVGMYRVTFLAEGYFAGRANNVVVTSGAAEEILVQLSPRGSEREDDVLELQEKVIQAEKDPIIYTKAHEAVSNYKMTRNDLLQSPGALQDISYNIQFLPGVIRTNDQTADLVVRGGDPDENAYLLEGIPVFSINHFEDNTQSGGAIGNINTYFIDNIKFHNGAFAARYPDKMSSVMELSFKKGNAKRHAGMFTFDAAGLGGVIEGPVPLMKGETNYGLTMRYSALSFLDAAGIIDFGGVPRYQNLHLKVNHKLGKHVLNFNLLGGRDEIDLTDGYSSSWRNGDSLALYRVASATHQYTHNLIAGTRWSYRTAGRQTSLYAAWNIRKRVIEDRGSRLLESATFDAVDRTWSLWSDTSRGARVLYGADQSFFLGRKWTARAGLLHDYFLPRSARRQGDSLFFADTLLSWSHYKTMEDRFFTIAGYGELLYQGNGFDVYLGYRHFYDEFMQAGAPQPRASLKWYLGRFALKCASGLFTQSPALKLAGLSRVEADELPKSWHNVAGWEGKPWKYGFLSLELFDKQYFDLITTRVDTSGGKVTTIAGNTGRRISRGFDLHLKQDLGGDFWATGTYTYARNRERRSGGWKRYLYSIPHYFTGALGYDFSKVYTGSVRFSTASGTPFTKQERDIITGQWREGERFAASTGTFSRLDVRMDYRRSYSALAVSIFLEVTNLLDNRNLFAMSEHTLREGWGFFPVGGIMLSF